jgi:hypothetical protein
MSKATDIVFGDPVMPIASATEGTLDPPLLTVSGTNVTIHDAAQFKSGRMKVQWKVDGRPAPQVRRLVDVGTLVIAVHLNEK